jgi:hypothetical protein
VDTKTEQERLEGTETRRAGPDDAIEYDTGAGGFEALDDADQATAEQDARRAGRPEGGDELPRLERAAHQRSEELQASLPEAARGRVTMSAGIAEGQDGQLHTVVGTSEPRGYLRPGVTLQPGETMATGNGHAEENVLATAKENRWRPVTVGAGRPHCDECVDAIEASGATTASPRRTT